TEIAQLPTAVIDHHSAGTPFGEVRYIDSRSPSVTLLILKLIETAGEEPTKAEAELLLFGLCTDTGFFRHLERGSQDVFAASGRLIAAGASPRGTFLRMFGNRTYESRKLLGRLLEKTEQRYGGRLLVTWETAEELAEFGKQHRDSDAVYQQLQMVRGCDIVVFVRQESAERCSVGLRSTGAVDVGKMATHFGGGGHRNASGYERPGQVTEVAAEIIDYLGPMLL
ncbi:MAG: bifunctional oligoribonuclease/PAP phosphatase NrnA, partial [Spirochaetales bacterium]|nr:bifunctional oligoribonuclease/PAP phosphatase NrnA [Spirochaetales bacterium]